MTARCPPDLALEEYLLDPSTSGNARHVERCAPCQAQLARMEDEGRRFRQYVFPATLARIEEEAARAGAPRWRPWKALPTSAAVALAVLLAFHQGAVPRRPAGPPAADTQLKGGALALTVLANAPGGAEPIADGASVPAGAALRFRVTPTSACRLWIVSVDASGVSRLFPTTGDEGAELVRGGVVPGGAVLDDERGPERVFAFCGRAPVKYATLEQALLRAVAQGERAVRAVAAVPGLPDDVAQASVLVEKTRDDVAAAPRATEAP